MQEYWFSIMDSLYDNLENYDDENNLDELKKENSELKMKLAEYNVAMEKLQKEFRNLSTEFKKLEKNYSSLLKTAKEEIKRKTDLITQLNTEKDVLVIKTMQKIQSNNVIRSLSPQNSQNKNKAPDNKGCNKKEQIGEQNERKIENRLSTAVTVTSTDSMGTGKHTRKTDEKYYDKEKDYKENICNIDKSKMNTDTSRLKPMSIRNRRKSMPSIRCEAKFSSDDEYVDKLNSNRRHATVNHDRDRDSIKSHNDLLQKRFHDNRIAQASSTDDKYSNYYDNKEFRSKSTWHPEIEKNRYKGQNASSRFTRQYSPDRHRFSRNFLNDCNYRQENCRNKVLESSHPDKFRHHPRTFEPRNHDPRRHDREDYYTRSKERYENKYTVKHKLPHDSEEPTIKRRRNDSSHYPIEEKWKESDKVCVQSAIPTDIVQSAIPIGIGFPSTSCQSPDYVDISSPHPVKEIMDTAVIQLEDPRLNSKNYIFDKNNDVLSTTVGRNYDLKVLTAKDWNVEPVQIPEALIHRPSQCREDRNVLDVEYATSNISVESGEILGFNTDEESVKNNCDGNKGDCKLKAHGKPTSRKRSDRVRDSKNISEGNIKHNDMNIEQNSMISQIQTSNVEILQSKYSANKVQKDHDLPIDNIKSDIIQEKTLIDVSLRKMVEGDLELSDDTCDVTVVSKKDNNEASTKHNNLEKSSKANIVGNITLASENNIITDVFSNKQSISSKNKMKESTDDETIKENPQKQKKRSLKLSKKAKSDSNTEMKNKPKNESKEIKTKFCELFGDSSSLITPEDLGIHVTPVTNPTSPKGIPLCEDAQDAVDLNATNLNIEVNYLEPVKPSVSNDRVSSNHPDNYILTVNDSILSTDELKSKCSSTYDGEIHNSNCLQSSVKKVQVQESNDNILNDVKIDSKTVTEKPPEVVSVQSILIKYDGVLKALATSTPHKETSLNEVVSIPDRNLQTHKDDVTKDKDETVEQSSANNTFDSNIDANAPDVRIFVKRRRKILRRAKT